MPDELFTKICFELGSNACERGDLALTNMLYQKGFSAVDPAAQAALARALMTVGRVYAQRKRYRDATRFYKKSMAIYKRMPSSDSEGVQDVLDLMAELYCRQGKYTQAAKTYGMAMEIEGTLEKKDHQRIRNRIQQIAWLHLRLGNYETAQSAYKMAASFHDAPERSH